MHKQLYLIISIFLLSHSVQAFDSEREGLVIGGGIGYAPTAYIQINNFNNSKETLSGFAGSLIAGFGYNENTQFLLMLEGFKADTHTMDSLAEAVWQGFAGVGVRFYFDDIGSSFFISSGIGLQFYQNSNEAEFSHDAGLGFLINGGYEFTEYLQFQTSLLTGQTKDSFKWDHVQLVITVSLVLY